MTNQRTLLTGVLAGAALAAGGGAQASERDEIRIVGSSTVYPFASYVSEEFGAVTEFSTPVIESTGSGGGLKIFCEGDGMDTPDITNASRRIKPSELERCQDNGVTEMSEFTIGSDGIVVAQDDGNDDLNLSREQLTLAVAAEVPQDGELVDNPYENWSDIDSSLPDREITIYGPPSTSGTRDAFEELVMGASTADMDGYDEEYTTIRDDGPYVDSGENDNLIVQRIQNDTDAVGVFGYSFLSENTDKIKAVTIDGIEPEPEAISRGEYPVARSLFFYTKNSHFDNVAGMREYVDMFLSEQMIGDDGVLLEEGLIPLPEGEREASRETFESMTRLSMEDLEE